jgi:hypothetical protein
MFDLEAALSGWRRQAKSQLKSDPESLAELEDHLREELAALVRCGHAEEIAWRLAVSKLGDPGAIGREFAKIDRLPVVDRLVLASIVGAGALAVPCLFAFLFFMREEAIAKPLLTIHVLTITVGYLAGLLAAAAASYGTLRIFFAAAPTTGLQAATLRLVRVATLVAATFTVLGFVLGAIWASGAWGRPFSADPREIGGLLVAISFGAATITAWRSAMSARISLAIAIGGGGIVLAAWFGVVARASGYPVLLSTIGFGGLGVSLLLAAMSLARRVHA